MLVVDVGGIWSHMFLCLPYVGMIRGPTLQGPGYWIGLYLATQVTDTAVVMEDMFLYLLIIIGILFMIYINGCGNLTTPQKTKTQLCSPIQTLYLLQMTQLCSLLIQTL